MLELSKEKLNIKKHIYEDVKELTVEGDMIIPDSKPDILKAINISGNPTIYKKEIMEGKIRIDGSIDTYIMYLADSEEEKTRGLNTSLDFSEVIDIEEALSTADLIINSVIKNLECKIINERKINIKISVDLQIKINSKEEVEFITDIKENANMQIKKEKIEISSLIGEGFSKIYGKETLPIDNTEEFAEILKANINLINKEVKLSYNKVLTKTEAEVKILYLTEENNIKTVTQKIPIVGFIDIQSVTENSNCEVNYEIRNIVIKPNSSEEHSIYVELEVGVKCVAFEEREISIIKDLYNPKLNLEISSKKMTIKTKQKTIKQKSQIKDSAHIEGLDKKVLLDVDINVVINNENITSTEIKYESELRLNFIMLNKMTSNIEMQLVKMPFDFVTGNIDNVSKVKASVEIGMQDFIIKD